MTLKEQDGNYMESSLKAFEREHTRGKKSQNWIVIWMRNQIQQTNINLFPVYTTITHSNSKSNCAIQLRQGIYLMSTIKRNNNSSMRCNAQKNCSIEINRFFKCSECEFSLIYNFQFKMRFKLEYFFLSESKSTWEIFHSFRANGCVVHFDELYFDTYIYSVLGWIHFNHN